MAACGSSLYNGSDLIHDYSCSKCEENDLNTEAQYFCPQCEHYLCDKCVNLHNGYHDKHTVYGRGDIQKWVGFSLDRCDVHGDKLTVHCDDHEELCCSVCSVTASVTCLTWLKIKILDKLEKKTVEHLDGLVEGLETINDDIECCANMNDQLKAMTEKLQQITGKHKETNYFIGFRKCQNKLNEVKSRMQEIQKMPTPYEIHFLSVTREKIETLRKFMTYLNCRSIAHNQGQLYMCSGNALDKFDLCGRHVKTIYEDMSCKRTVVKCAVSPDGKVIYVTNNTKRELITLDECGQVLFKLKDPELQRLSGLCVNPSGLVFVCGQGSQKLCYRWTETGD
ncbi:uncharacterized protein LOC128208494 [Mya arenaria]|uniref:uncharacterized protein LOC128208494 n=1 Tax=Mya arenaria TaxID=6604 RepID=UPI0022E59A05|nr:uncharacterized protein LOC128208494 [Mya arenaria]